jgi:AcrR family transcriptional regulator
MTEVAANVGLMTSTESFPPDEQPATTRERLIAEGLHAFTTSGFDGTSLRDVERRAGVSRGLVAHHFGTKDGLWRECVNWLMQRFHDEMVRVHNNLADVSPVERARVLLKV